MEVKLGYKQTEVGVIPKEWEVKPLGEIGGVRMCKRVLKHQTREYGDVPFYKIGTFGGVADAFIPQSLYDEFRRKYSFPRKGDILISAAGTIGRTVSYDGAPAYFQDSNIVWIDNDESKAKNAYLWHRYQVTKWSVSHGGTVARLYNDNLRTKIYIAVPSLPEQHAIAEALSDVDGLLGGLDRLIAKKRDLKQAAMQQLLTGQTRLPGFHGEWEVKRLGDFGKCLRGVSYKGDSDLSTHDTPHTKRLLRSNNVQNAVVVTDEVQFVSGARVSAHQILQQDDILICMANGSKALVGKAGIFMLSDGHEYTFGAFMGCFRTNATESNPAFVFYLFLTARYRDYINNLLAGSSINNLRPSIIESLEFSTPPHPEQTAIASVLSEMDGELAVLEQRREKTRALKQAMMQELLTGRTRLL